jgi:hydrogenase maturation protease
MNHVLIIGYGSTLRGDDGVGPRVAELIERQAWRSVEALPCHQLTPELADPISRAQAVVFVDASLEQGIEGVRMEVVEAAPAHQVMVHTASPATLLHLARSVFGHCPPAWLVSIPVSEMGIGEQLSPMAERGVTEAVAKIGELLRHTGLGQGPK